MYKKCPAVYNVLIFFYKFHSLTADSDTQVGLGIPSSFTKPSYPVTSYTRVVDGKASIKTMRKKDQEKINESADLVKSLLKETKEKQLLENPIYRIHKEIGFPTLSNEKQAELLLTNSTKIINELTPGFEATCVPVELYREYVKMSKSIFRDFFIKSNYIKENQLLYEKFPRSDGDWIVEKKGGKFEFIYQERGAIFSSHKFETKDELIDYLINIIYKRYNLD